ncbi:MAG: phosphonate C-P lyase system protein PhnH [Firmicutes bacterium]|nr:phosphonate C-P lyase system protein PhnH [Bacillota bacterium]
MKEMWDISWFDPVYSSQRVFRQLLDCMARPGKIAELRGGEGESGDFLYVVALALTLMDEETTFATLGPGWEEFVSFCKFYTGSRPAAPEQADFVFIDGDRPGPELIQVRRGNLLFPDQGATVICRVNAIYPGAFQSAGEGIVLRLRGPGVPGERELTVAGLARENLACLEKLNSEFPLGVDTILVSVQGQLACIPRSSGMTWC